MQRTVCEVCSEVCEELGLQGAATLADAVDAAQEQLGGWTTRRRAAWLRVPAQEQSGGARADKLNGKRDGSATLRGALGELATQLGVQTGWSERVLAADKALKVHAVAQMVRVELSVASRGLGSVVPHDATLAALTALTRGALGSIDRFCTTKTAHEKASTSQSLLLFVLFFRVCVDVRVCVFYPRRGPRAFPPA